MPMEFYRMTQGEFLRYCLYHDLVVIEQKDQTRMLMTTIVKLAGNKNVKPEKLMPLWPDYIAKEEEPKPLPVAANSQESKDRWERFKQLQQSQQP